MSTIDLYDVKSVAKANNRKEPRLRLEVRTRRFVRPSLSIPGANRAFLWTAKDLAAAGYKVPPEPTIVLTI